MIRPLMASASATSCRAGQDRELVATQARGQVLGADLVADALGDGDQQLVADGVTRACR